MRNDWRYPIYEVLRHLHQNLDRSVSLDEAANQVAFSPYYLHRRFRESVGETVGGMSRRLRLEKAAHLLRRTRLAVGEVAVECGFESVEAFCRVFKKEYGLSATELRRQKMPQLQLDSPSGIHYRQDIPECIDIPLPLGDHEMSINIVKMKPMRVLSMRGMGDYWGMPELWAKFMAYLQTNDLHRQDAWFMSVFHDHNESTPIEKKRYDVSMTVQPDFETPDDHAFVQDIEGGEYVIYTFRGDNEGIGPAWNHFRSTWFHENRFKLREGAPSIEWYRTCPSTPLEHMLTDLCDPIEPDTDGVSRIEGTWPH
jgi:AraC family transcriptional regulator